MSDEKNAKQDSLSFDKSDTETTDTNSPSQPVMDDHATENFGDIQTNITRRSKIDPAKDTNVFAANDRRLQRILNSQSDENFSTMSLGDKQEVILLIRGMVERVIMEVGIIYKLGRFEIGAAADDEIDLTPYGAQDRGVSRVHAELQILEGIVHITDLGSTNGTFVNTRQLKPDTPTPLRKGDELLLGRLAVQILFR